MEINPGIIELQKAAAIIADNLRESIWKKDVMHTHALYDSVNWKVVGDTIHILYNYYGMFPDMGVGRGISTGDVAMMRGSGGRRAKKWYSPVIYREVARLAEKTAKLTGITTTATILADGERGSGADVVAIAV
jgi:hypothetical protein